MKAVKGMYENGAIRLFEDPQVHGIREVYILFPDVAPSTMHSIPAHAFQMIDGIVFVAILALIGQHQGRRHFHEALLALEAQELGIPYSASVDPDFDAISWLQRIASPEGLAMVSARPEG